MHKRYLVIVLTVTSFLLLIPPKSWTGDIKIEEDIVFAKVNQDELKLDIASPIGGNGPYPALIYIFDTDWGSYNGSRRLCKAAIVSAAEHGYVAITCDYRQTDVMGGKSSKYRFPDQVYDVKCAVRWLRANAEKYHVDPEKIGAAGFCCGGHLALMLGLTRPADELEGSFEYSEYSSQVQAVVSSAGATDLASLYENSMSMRIPLEAFIKGVLFEATPRDMPVEYAKASPISYVYQGCPPIFTIHGENDKWIPLNQAFLLDERMKGVGSSHTLIIKKNAGHVDFTVTPEVFEFFNKCLK